MHGLGRRFAVVVSWLLITPAAAFAQGTIAGVVRDSSGAVLPGGFEISARKTYDHISAGMMASAAELGLTAKSEGIITLHDGSATPGQDAREILGSDDTVFEVNVTPDRGYALSARGLTRELSSAFGLSFTDLKDDPEVGLSAAARGADVPRAALPEVAGEAFPVELREETGAARFGLLRLRGPARHPRPRPIRPERAGPSGVVRFRGPTGHRRPRSTQPQRGVQAALEVAGVERVDEVVGDAAPLQRRHQRRLVLDVARHRLTGTGVRLRPAGEGAHLSAFVGQRSGKS